MLMAQNFPAFRTTMDHDGLGYKNADPKFMTTQDFLKPYPDTQVSLSDIKNKFMNQNET